MVNDLFRLECIPELGVLEISDYFANGYLVSDSLRNNSNFIWETYGIGSYSMLIDVFEVEDILYQKQKTFETTCKLRTKDSLSSNQFETYFITLEGLVFNERRDGDCGLANSFSLSIRTKDQIIINQIPFIDSCRGQSSIHSITLYPHEGYITVRGKGIDDKIKWIKEAPLKNENFYFPPKELPLSCESGEIENMHTGKCETR